MDFIIDLLEFEGYKHLWVVKCKLLKWVYLIVIKIIEAEVCVIVFFRYFIGKYEWFNNIVSDKGSN